MNMADGSEMNSDEAKREQRLEAVIADYIRACEAGGPPDQWEILATHPELAADLQEIFANRDRMNQIAAPMATPEEQPTLFPESVQIGLCIGSYTLVQKLGEGGMGEVWVAKQSEPVRRKVALKLIKRGMNSKAVRHAHQKGMPLMPPFPSWFDDAPWNWSATNDRVRRWMKVVLSMTLNLENETGEVMTNPNFVRSSVGGDAVPTKMGKSKMLWLIGGGIFALAILVVIVVSPATKDGKPAKYTNTDPPVERDIPPLEPTRPDATVIVKETSPQKMWLMVVLDCSNSMNEKMLTEAGVEEARFDIAKKALKTMLKNLLAESEKTQCELHIGLIAYGYRVGLVPTNDQRGAKLVYADPDKMTVTEVPPLQDVGAVKNKVDNLSTLDPSLDVGVLVSIKNVWNEESYLHMTSLIDRRIAVGVTPLYLSIVKAAEHMKFLPNDAPRLILVITDGVENQETLGDTASHQAKREMWGLKGLSASRTGETAAKNAVAGPYGPDVRVVGIGIPERSKAKVEGQGPDRRNMSLKNQLLPARGHVPQSKCAIVTSRCQRFATRTERHRSLRISLESDPQFGLRPQTRSHKLRVRHEFTTYDLRRGVDAGGNATLSAS